MRQPIFSVVIPAYNPNALLLKTLDSVMSQSFKDFEVILIDDCSLNNVEELIKPFLSSPKIRLIRNLKNSERAACRNRGMQEASGKFVTLLDADDLMYPDNLKDAYDYSCTHPNIKFFHNLFEIVNPSGKRSSQQVQKLSNNPKWDLMNGNFLACIGTFIHYDLYKTVFFDETRALSVSEDYEYWLRLLSVAKVLGRIEKINSALVEHEERSVHQASLKSICLRTHLIIDKIKSNSQVCEFYGKRFISRFEAIRYSQIAMLSLVHGDIAQARTYASRAFNTDRSLITHLPPVRVLLAAYIPIFRMYGFKRGIK